MDRKLYRSNKDKMLGGVCGGLAEYFDVDATIVRVVFVISLFLGGTGILAYILLWIIVPEEPFYFNMPKDKSQQETTGQSETSTQNENSSKQNSSGTQSDFSQQNYSNTQSDFAKAWDQQKQTQRKKRSTFFGAALIVLGFIVLADTWIPHLHFFHFFPIILIALGIGLIIKSK